MHRCEKQKPKKSLRDSFHNHRNRFFRTFFFSSRRPHGHRDIFFFRFNPPDTWRLVSLIFFCTATMILSPSRPLPTCRNTSQVSGALLSAVATPFQPVATPFHQCFRGLSFPPSRRPPDPSRRLSASVLEGRRDLSAQAQIVGHTGLRVEKRENPLVVFHPACHHWLPSGVHRDEQVS